jgi:septum formation protein
MLILGSGSARRKELLESASIDFEMVPNGFDESSIAYNDDPEDYCQTLALKKAEFLLDMYPDKIILTADTIVEIEGDILGKPKDEFEAIEMLNRLNDKRHRVYTGVCIVSGRQSDVFVESASVTFKKISSLDIESYVKTKEPMDKSGAYAIQGIGSKFIEEYNGDFHTIMGLPLKTVLKKLEAFGIYPKLK